GEEAFGVAAIRAPGGPAAVIGSQGVSYSAMGYLSLLGMLETMRQEPEFRTVGRLWEGVQQGLSNAQMEAADFKMLDMADGSGGKFSPDVQRAEHLEMWMLLGDPAMLLVADVPSIRVEAKLSSSGTDLEVE